MDKSTPFTHPPDDWSPPGQSKEDLRKRIAELEARIDKALKHLPERPGMAMKLLLEQSD